MPRKPSEFELGPNWHLDYRDLASLPEDRVVRVRFLVNTCAGVLTLILLTIVGWQLLARHGIATQLRFWDEKIAAHQREYSELQLVLRDYMTESDKIKDAYDLIYSPFIPSEFVLAIGRTLPDRMTVDMIGYADGMVTIRGNLAEPPEPASRVLGRYIDTLRNDAQIGALFGDISARSLDRAKDGDLFNFEIVLKPH
ncbi:MAG TPA: hypothetical protein VLW52_16610 [Opitutaceae bacterium]|nr:hypothetical protein [Opitutaceae bacterium]